jgi:GTPase SAR1 family protein
MKANNSFCIVVIGMSGTGKTTLVGVLVALFRK